MTPHELLVRARGLISDPEEWASRGEDLESGRYCAYTATYCGHTDADMRHEIDQRTRKEALRALADAGGWAGFRYSDVPRIGKRVIEFNDSHTHEEVLALFDRAIEATA